MCRSLFLFLFSIKQDHEAFFESMIQIVMFVSLPIPNVLIKKKKKKRIGPVITGTYAAEK